MPDFTPSIKDMSHGRDRAREDLAEKLLAERPDVDCFLDISTDDRVRELAAAYKAMRDIAAYAVAMLESCINDDVPPALRTRRDTEEFIKGFMARLQQHELDRAFGQDDSE